MVAVIAGLHVIGWGLFVHYNGMPAIHLARGGDGTLAYAGAGALAYTFGLRHAFDADHISAIDDTTRYLLQNGKQTIAVGFFFSLGHSTVVFGFVTALAAVASRAEWFQRVFQGPGGIVGTIVSGLFLYVIAGLNLAVLRGILDMWRRIKRGEHSPEQFDVLMAQRGFMNRIFKGRYNKLIRNSWQMYPVGVLFGLGFDTATQVGLIAIAGTTAVAGGLPALAIIALPVLYAAGMSLMDTVDGVFMAKTYSWAFVNPARKIYYNLTTTGLSVLVAFVIGSIELLSLLTRQIGLRGEPWRFLGSIDINLAGRIVVGIFFTVWIVAVVNWKVRRLDDRYDPGVPNGTGRDPRPGRSRSPCHGSSSHAIARMVDRPDGQVRRARSPVRTTFALRRIRAAMPGGETGCELREPPERCIERAPARDVEDLATAPRSADQSGRLQDAQVLDHRLPGDGQTFGEARRGSSLRADEQFQQPPARGIGQRSEDGEFTLPRVRSLDAEICGPRGWRSRGRPH
jgi:nickel/cobalt transporter (NiCoT) family protein